MAKVSNIFDVIQAGIQAESLRQKTIASNIANLETPGYRRSDVKFAEALDSAMGKDGEVDMNSVEAEIYQPKTTAVLENGNDVNLDLEVGEMVKNTLRHKAYVRLLQKKYMQMDLAISVR
jgi:flagellar basal-body rod protein FlgB